MKKAIAICAFTLSSLLATPFEICKNFKMEKTPQGIEGIDTIYIINLDARIEKLTKSLNQLKTFNIQAQRFGAIDGKKLSQAEIEKASVIYQTWMQNSRWAQNLGAPTPSFTFLNEKAYGKPITSVFLKKGALGCTLSHLTLIKNAYEQNFSRILILEDDFKIIQNPHTLSGLIQKLDGLVGANNWDILYTDLDTHDAPIYFEKNTFITPLKGLDLAWFLRPDISLDPDRLFFRKPISEDFIRLGSRMRTHAYILNRSGMEKIVHFYQTHGVFCPIDHELFLIQDFNAYSLTYPVISFEETGSDTKGAL